MVECALLLLNVIGSALKILGSFLATRDSIALLISLHAVRRSHHHHHTNDFLMRISVQHTGELLYFILSTLKSREFDTPLMISVTTGRLSF
jgi:hypothetical protein